MSVFHRCIDWFEQRLNLSEIFSFWTTFGILYAPLDANRPVREVVREALLRPLPSYQRWPHVFGILTFVTFLLEVITGWLLAFYFQPTTDAAYESTRLIIRDTAFGWYIHQMHYWGGHLLAVLLLLRLVRFFWHRVYKFPHELTWIFGVILFLLAVQACFTGKLLPWNQNGYWGTIRGLELFERIPLFGPAMEYFVGGFKLEASLILRFYLLHVIFLPLLMFSFFYLHFASVRRVGLSAVPALEEKSAPIYPRHLMNLLIILLTLLGGLLSLAILLPATFAAKADPFQTPPGISISWYLLPLYGLFELAPWWLASWGTFLATWMIVLFPFIDPETEQTPQRRRTVVWLACLAGLVLLILSYYGYSRRG